MAENGKKFYAEISDFDASKLNVWTKENILPKLQLSKSSLRSDAASKEVIGVIGLVGTVLSDWLSQFEKIEFWGDCLAFGYTLLFELIADKSFDTPRLPENISYIPRDLCTLMAMQGIDPDISREILAWGVESDAKHNAIHRAETIKACYKKLID